MDTDTYRNRDRIDKSFIQQQVRQPPSNSPGRCARYRYRYRSMYIDEYRYRWMDGYVYNNKCVPLRLTHLEGVLDIDIGIGQCI